jgi:hypothetical protein
LEEAEMFEIRNYYFEPTRFDEYKEWAAATAVPYLRGKLDILGFWVNNDMDPLYGGSLPRAENMFTANITWIIRWEDRAQRDKTWEEIVSDPEWNAIVDRVPGGRASYLSTEVKFATEM